MSEGVVPAANDRPCDRCGHVWFAGERPHVFASDTGAERADGDVLCALCARQLELTPRDDD